MKKVTALLLTIALAVAAGALSLACGKIEATATEYTVTFELNYSGAPAASVVKVKDGEKVSRPADPSRSGYKFDGWYLDSQEYNFDEPVKANLTLSARWSSTDTPVVKENLTFIEADGFKYVFERGSAPVGVQIGERVQFMIEPSPFYLGEPKVLANGEALLPDSSGVYTVTVSVITEITVEGLVADTSFMNGLGTKEKPYQIATPAQWVTVANMINSLSGNIGKRHFELVADLDFRGFEIPCIELFNGTFDGKGHTMSDFVIRVSEYVSTPEDINSITDSVNAGLFGRIVGATIKNLNIKNADVNVAGNSVMNAGVLAGDAVSSTVRGVTASGTAGYTNTFAYYTTIGGLIGHVRTVSVYGPSYVLFCNSEVTVNSDYLAYAGGLIGGLSGDAEAVAAVVGCASMGNVLGGHSSGGIAGYMGSYTSVTNCYSTGNVTAETDSDMGSSSAGGIAGYFSDVEAVIANSFSTSAVVASAPNSLNAVRGDIFGEQGNGFSDAAPYATKSAVFVSYYSSRGTVSVENEEYSFTDADAVRALLGWNTDKWIFDGGYPVPKSDASTALSLSFTVDLNGKTISENGVSASGSQVFTVSEFTAVMHLSGNGLVPVRTGVLLSGGNGVYSTGIYSDAACENPLPAAYLITDNEAVNTVYIGFADYSRLSGNYLFTHSGVAYELSLELDGKGSVNSGAKSHAFGYGVSGDGKLFLSGLPAFLSSAEYNEAAAENGKLTFGNITAYAKHDAAGTWFAADGTEYVFELNGLGTVGGVQTEFVFESNGVTVNGNTLVLSADAQTLSGGSLTLTRSDIYAGEWEADVYVSDYIEFDGKGRYVTLGADGTESGSYTLDGNKLTLTAGNENFEFTFDARGYLICGNGIAYGLKGGFAGVWTDEGKGYSLTLDGLTRHGYGYASDTDGNRYYYTVEQGKINFYNGGAFSFAATVRGEGLSATILLNNGERSLKAKNALSGDWFDSDKRKLAISFDKAKLGSNAETVFAYADADTIVFQSGGKIYVAVLIDGNTLALGDSENLDSEPVIFRKHDSFFGELTNSDGSLVLDFNGLGELGGGKVSVKTADSAQEYAYSVNANGVAQISGYGNVTFNDKTGLWSLARASQEPVALGIVNKYAGQWSVQMNAGASVLVELLNADYEGTGAVWWFSENGQAYLAYFFYNDELGGLDVCVNVQTQNGDELTVLFTMVEKADGMTFVSGETELPLAPTDDARGAWYAYSASGTGALEFDGVGLTSDYYRGLLKYYRTVVDKDPEVFLYDNGYYNGERMPCIYAISDGGLMLYATFEFADKTAWEDRVKELVASGIKPEVYINAPTFTDATAVMLVKLFHADALATVEAEDAENENVYYDFGTGIALDVRYGEFDCGYMRIIEVVNGSEKATEYVYRTEYVSDDGGTFVLSVYEHGSDLESPVFMAVVKVQDGKATVTLADCATAEKLPFAEL